MVTGCKRYEVREQNNLKVNIYFVTDTFQKETQKLLVWVALELSSKSLEVEMGFQWCSEVNRDNDAF